MQTKYVIKMTMKSRPDLDYFYAGIGRSGLNVFELKKARAKRYDFIEEADRDMRILKAIDTVGETFEVLPVRCRI